MSTSALYWIEAGEIHYIVRNFVIEFKMRIPNFKKKVLRIFNQIRVDIWKSDRKKVQVIS